MQQKIYSNAKVNYYKLDVMKEGVLRCIPCVNSNASEFKSQTSQQGQLQYCPGLDRVGGDEYFRVNYEDVICHFCTCKDCN